MLFGKPRRGLFSGPRVYGAPPFSPGPPQPDAVPAVLSGAVPGLGAGEPARPGLGTRLFGRGWEDKAFALGGLMQGDGGRAIAGMREAQQQQALAAQQAAAAEAADMRKRSLDFADWQRREQWERDNPQPAEDAFTRSLTALGIDPASAAARPYHEARLASMTRDPQDEFIVAPIPGMGTYAGPRSGLAQAMQGAGTAPARPQGRLTPVDGGPTLGASAPFRP